MMNRRVPHPVYSGDAPGVSHRDSRVGLIDFVPVPSLVAATTVSFTSVAT